MSGGWGRASACAAHQHRSSSPIDSSAPGEGLDTHTSLFHCDQVTNYVTTINKPPEKKQSSNHEGFSITTGSLEPALMSNINADSSPKPTVIFLRSLSAGLGSELLAVSV